MGFYFLFQSIISKNPYRREAVEVFNVISIKSFQQSTLYFNTYLYTADGDFSVNNFKDNRHNYVGLNIGLNCL